MSHDNIIPIKFDDYRNFDAFDIEVYEKEYHTKNKYTILYNLMVYANKEAKKIVKNQLHIIKKRTLSN